MQRSRPLISLPLVKFSKAKDVHKDVQRLAYDHYTEQGLVIVIDDFGGAGTRTRAPSQVLKVLRQTTVMDVCPVQELIGQAHETIMASQRMGMEIRNEHLAISALVRRPLLAIRYDLPNAKVRRIQLRFKTNEDFDMVYNHLRDLGLRISIHAGDRRPSTAQIPRQTNITEISGPSCPPERLAGISNRPHTAATPSYRNAYSGTAPRISSPLARQLSIPSTYSQEAIAADPVENDAFTTRTSIVDPLIPPEYFQRPKESEPYSSILDRPSSRAVVEHENDSTLPTIEEETILSNIRPRSATISARSDGTLPPRRELPFARPTPPKSSGNDDTQPSSRPSSATMGPPPLPPPSRGSGRSSSFGRSTSRDASSPVPRPISLGDTNQQRRPSSSPTRLSSLITADPLPLPTPTFLEKSQRNGLGSASPEVPSTPVASVQRNRSPLHNFGAGAPNMLSSSSPLAALPTPLPSEASYQHNIISEITKDAEENANAALASYGAQSDEDRMTMLNDFMMQHIDDDNFIKLAEDVSACWMRIGMGLG